MDPLVHPVNVDSRVNQDSLVVKVKQGKEVNLAFRDNKELLACRVNLGTSGQLDNQAHLAREAILASLDWQEI